MRATSVALLLALVGATPFVGGFEAPEFDLRAASVVPAPPAAPAPCVPTGLTVAPLGRGFNLVAWEECAGAESYQLLRGPSAAELLPLVEVNHASHVDVASESLAAVYAVRVPGGPLSATVTLPLG